MRFTAVVFELVCGGVLVVLVDAVVVVVVVFFFSPESVGVKPEEGDDDERIFGVAGNSYVMMLACRLRLVDVARRNGSMTGCWFPIM